MNGCSMLRHRRLYSSHHLKDHGPCQNNEAQGCLCLGFRVSIFGSALLANLRKKPHLAQSNPNHDNLLQDNLVSWLAAAIWIQNTKTKQYKS